MGGRGGSGAGGRKRTTIASVLAHITGGGGLHAVLARDGAFRSDGLPRAAQVRTMIARLGGVGAIANTKFRNVPVVGVFRAKGGGYRFALSDGNHRIQIGKALGGKKIAVKLDIEGLSRSYNTNRLVDL